MHGPKAKDQFWTWSISIRSCLRGVSDEPVHPVEERSSAVVGVAARQGDQRLHEAQPRANDAQQRVRVLGDRDLRPALLWWGEKGNLI